MKPESPRPRRASAPRPHPTTRWHRVLGIVSAAVVIVTTLTGLLLNHSDGLALPRRHPDSVIIDHLYRQRAPALNDSFATARGWVTQIGTKIYLDSRPLAEHDAPLVGAIALTDTLFVAYSDLLVEYGPQTAVQESFSALDGMQLPIKRIGIGSRDGVLIVDTTAGLLKFDPVAASLVPISENAEPLWSTRAVLPAELTQDLIHAERGAGISYERFLLDLHSGRLFGRYGPWVVDAAALCLLILTLTGTYMWFKFKRPSTRAERRSPR